MSEQTNISFEAALMIALRADAQKELDTLPTPEQLEELYPDTSQWDERMAVALRRKKHRPMLKRVLVAALTLVVLTLGALAVSADFRKAVYTMIQKFLPIEMQLTYQVDGEPLERLPDGYSDHTVNGSIYQTYYQVDAQTRTGVKKISVSGVLYEKGTIGTWQKVSSCSNSSTTSTCVGSGNFNTKPGKSYRLEYSATFSYSDGRSETITGSTSR
ncbi:MAG: Tat pathway signal sequence [Faecalibacterium prausnitzii]